MYRSENLADESARHFRASQTLEHIIKFLLQFFHSYVELTAIVTRYAARDKEKQPAALRMMTMTI